VVVYDGAMLPKDAFLRNLPAGLHAEQRLRFDALLFAADIMDVALGRIRAVTSEKLLTIGEASTAERAALFSDCWTIVDQVHVIRQVLRGPHFGDRLSARTAAYVAQCEVAWALRNKMDHLNGNIANIVAAKGPSSPLFGALSYFVVLPEDTPEVNGVRQVTGGHSVAISAGSSAGEQIFQVLNPIGATEFRVPVGLFRFEAFGLQFELERAVEDFRPIIAAMNEKLRATVTEAATAEAARLGVSVDEAMKVAPKDFTFVAQMAFMDEDAADGVARDAPG
jgi:hypothetical protein